MPSPIPPKNPDTGARVVAPSRVALVCSTPPALGVPTKIFAAATLLLIGSAIALVFWKPAGEQPYFAILDRPLLVAPLPYTVPTTPPSVPHGSPDGVPASIPASLTATALDSSHLKIPVSSHRQALNRKALKGDLQKKQNAYDIPEAISDQGNAKYSQTFPAPDLPKDIKKDTVTQQPEQKLLHVTAKFEPIHPLATPPPTPKRPRIDFADKPQSVSSVAMKDELLPYFFGVENLQPLASQEEKREPENPFQTEPSISHSVPINVEKLRPLKPLRPTTPAIPDES